MFRAEAFGNPDVLNDKVCLTFGNFDGFHLGHLSLISQLREMSTSPSVVVTFAPHPSWIVGNNPKPLLYSTEKRVQQLLEAGIDCVCVQEFGLQFSEMTADEFCAQYLKKMFRIDSVLFGYNFQYGKNRVGNWQHFKEFAAREHWKFARALPKVRNGLEISSSLVRNAVQQGNLLEAKEMLGRNYELFGKVVAGDKRGRELGFPTANMSLGKSHEDNFTGFKSSNTDLVLPKSGVYAVEIRLEGRAEVFRGVMNCGFRPTIGQGLKHQIEAHIFNFDEDIYGSNISFTLLSFLRSEKKFVDFEELKNQIDIDCIAAKSFFVNHSS